MISAACYLDESQVVWKTRANREDWECRENERKSFSRQDVVFGGRCKQQLFCLGFLLGTTFWPLKVFSIKNTHKPNEHTTNGWYLSQFSLSRSLSSSTCPFVPCPSSNVSCIVFFKFIIGCGWSHIEQSTFKMLSKLIYNWLWLSEISSILQCETLF